MSRDHDAQFGRLIGSDQVHIANANSAETVTGRPGFSGASGMLFEQAMAQTRMAVCLTDPNLPDDPIVFCNTSFEKLTGYPSHEIIGRNCRFLQGPKTSRRQLDRLKEALAREEVAVIELLNYRKDGSTFWNALHLGPIYDAAGKLVYFFGSQWDVTDIHLAREEEKHARMMAREVSHRLKNVFSVIGGIISITGRSLKVRDAADAINERVQALARAYEPTLDDAVFGTVEIGQAIKSVLQPYDPEGDRIGFTGNGVRTNPNAVSLIGLTLHELATNATKYGALSTESGTIEVGWRHEPDRHGRESLLIDWVERGGPAITEPVGTTGTGLTIADTLLAHSRAVLEREWHHSGLHAQIWLPIQS